MSITDKLVTHLNDLRYECGSWRKRAIKALITDAENCIQQNKEKNEPLDFMILLQPFIKAYEDENEVFQDISLEFLAGMRYDIHKLEG